MFYCTAASASTAKIPYRLLANTPAPASLLLYEAVMIEQPES